MIECIKVAGVMARERLVNLDLDKILSIDTVHVTIDKIRLSCVVVNLLSRVIKMTKFGSDLNLSLKIIRPQPSQVIVQFHMQVISG